MNAGERAPEASQEALQAEIVARFGVLPNFFRLLPGAPEFQAHLWRFARFSYLDNPLPPLFKERLFVFLSRFCQVRYCIGRHVGFLVGRGHPAGDRSCPPQSVDDAVRLLKRPLPQGDTLLPHLRLLEAAEWSAERPPAAGTAEEEAIFACAAHVFLQTPEATRGMEALRRALRPAELEHLTVLLTFIRMAHDWTRFHPELPLEEDIQELLATHEALAHLIRNDAEAESCALHDVLLDELATLRRERALREDLERANHALRATEERLREQDRRKDEFLATLAHELRNPLAPIRSGMQVIRLAPPGEIQDHAWDMVDRQLRQLVRLVDDLLDVNRISLGRIELRKERVELAAVVEDALQSTRLACRGMGHELRVTLPAEPVELDADPTRLAQALGNLLRNACNFTPPGGHVRLSGAVDGPTAEIRVTDDGIGIAADQLDRVFDLFVQVDTAAERHRGGLGVGLALVKRLVELHGGTVEVSSAGLGHGSTFTMRLPIAGAAGLDATQHAASPAPAAAVPRRILVVDDNRDSAECLAMLLRLDGHQVHVAHDGVQAVEQAARLPLDVVLLDIGLPGLNGYEAARRIRTQGGTGLLLIALTGWGREENRQQSAAAGFDAHLVKPVDWDELSRLLNDPPRSGC